MMTIRQLIRRWTCFFDLQIIRFTYFDVDDNLYLLSLTTISTKQPSFGCGRYGMRRACTSIDTGLYWLRCMQRAPCSDACVGCQACLHSSIMLRNKGTATQTSCTSILQDVTHVRLYSLHRGRENPKLYCFTAELSQFCTPLINAEFFSLQKWKCHSSISLRVMPDCVTHYYILSVAAKKWIKSSDVAVSHIKICTLKTFSDIILLLSTTPTMSVGGATENARPENTAPICRGGKCGTIKYGKLFGD